MSDNLERIRIDKWLWAARFFKTRSLAAQAIEGGRVRVNGERAKASKDLKPGDEVLIHIGELEWVVEVRAISGRRGPVRQAAMLYQEQEDSRLRREERLAQRRAGADPTRQLKGCPSKRDRRMIHRFTQGD